MKSKNLTYISLFSLICLFGARVEAAYTIRNGSLVNADFMAELPADEHYNLGCQAMERCNWREAARQFSILTTCFPSTQLGQEAYYYLGAAEFNLQEYDFSNDAFSEYLKCQNNPQNFLSAIEYKFCIAEQFRCGAKRRFCGTKQLPKWATGRTLALKIYDEIISAMPSSEIASQAMYSKACLLWGMQEYRDCIDSFQMICKRFPKGELTPECYVLISQVYIDLCQHEPQNPDVLAFAELNARKFKQEFPKEERVCEAEDNVQRIKELYAGALYQTGCFYEKTDHPRASIIYYYSAVKQFPDTQVAQVCKNRLYQLDPGFRDDEFVGEDCSKPEEKAKTSIDFS